MRLDYHKGFRKQYKKFPPKIRERFQQRLLLFVEDPFNPVLGNHQLHGRWDGFRSIDITGDIRAIYEELDDLAYFVAIGSHSQLYS